MRLVHDDVIKFMKEIAEADMSEYAEGDGDLSKASPFIAYDVGAIDGQTALARNILQKMGVSYG